MEISDRAFYRSLLVDQLSSTTGVSKMVVCTIMSANKQVTHEVVETVSDLFYVNFSSFI